MRLACAPLTLVLLPACSRADWSDPAKVASAIADVRIIEAVLDHRIRGANGQEPGGSQAIVMSTVGGVSLWHDREDCRKLGWGDSATWDAYFAAVDRPLRALPGVNPSFSLVSDFATRLGRGLDDQWYGGGAGFPGSAGYYWFGPLALSPSGQEAIVYSAYIWCGKWSYRSLHQLRLDAGEWRVVNESIESHPDPARMPPRDPDRLYD